jgi:beta-glucosidase
MASTYHFPPEFLWGAATAAHQIEGSPTADGKGPSIWDTFTHQNHMVTGDIACDHYNRWRDDVGLMQKLGLRAYRFSIAWPRIFPEGRGRLNEAGLAFYERLIDTLLDAKIVPFVTLYHWDLPDSLQQKNGWLNRDTSLWFGDYADQVTRRLGDRVQYWVTINEPSVVAFAGHMEGNHAPGWRDMKYVPPVMHHLLLAHGYAIQAMRTNSDHYRVGIAYSLTQVEPATDREEDIVAANLGDIVLNRFALDPVQKGRYPDEVLANIPTDFIQEGDLTLIGAPTDFIGVNYYTRTLVKSTSQQQIPGFTVVPPRSKVRTVMGWEIYPEGLGYLLRRLSHEFPGKELYITENGAAFPDKYEVDGSIYDMNRKAFLRDHVSVALECLAEGIQLKGYFVWSLLDNFEWNLGYIPRFGLISVDYKTQSRYIKESGHWYARLIGSGTIPDETTS